MTKNTKQAYQTGKEWMFNILIDEECLIDNDKTWNADMDVTEFNQVLVNANDPATPEFDTEEEINAFFDGAYSEYCSYFGI